MIVFVCIRDFGAIVNSRGCPTDFDVVVELN